MRYFSVKGIRKSLTGWADSVGISRQAMTTRINNSESPEELEMALTSPDFQGRSAKDMTRVHIRKKKDNLRLKPRD